MLLSLFLNIFDKNKVQLYHSAFSIWISDIRDVDLTLGREDPLEEGMATHTSILAWRIPWTEEPGGLQPIGPQSRT